MNILNNISNDSLCFFDHREKKYYYSNITSDEGKIYQTNSTFSKKEKLADIKDSKYIQKDGDNLYYCSENKIFSMYMPSMKQQLLYESEQDLWISDLYYKDGLLYFNVSDMESTQYVFNISNNQIKRLYEDAFGFYIFDNDIYYLGNTKKGTYRYNIKNENTANVMDINALYCLQYNNSIVFFDPEDHQIMEYSTLQGNLSVLLKCERDINSMNIYKDCLYLSDICGIFKRNLLTGDYECISKSVADQISILNNQIFCRVYYDSTFQLARISLETGDQHIVS